MLALKEDFCQQATHPTHEVFGHRKLRYTTAFFLFCRIFEYILYIVYPLQYPNQISKNQLSPNFRVNFGDVPGAHLEYKKFSR